MPNGAMEVPCRLHFLGVESKLKKLKPYFAKSKGFSVETTSAQVDDSAQCSSSIVKTEKSTAGVHDALVCAAPTSLKS